MASPVVNGLLASSSGELVAQNQPRPSVSGSSILAIDNRLAVGLIVAAAALFYWWHRIL